MTDDRISFLKQELIETNKKLDNLRLKLEFDKAGADYVEFIELSQHKLYLEYKLRKHKEVVDD